MNWFFTQAKCAEGAAAPAAAAPYQPPPGAAVSGLPKRTDFMDLPLPVKCELHFQKPAFQHNDRLT